jgi:hypothetical protein
MTSIRALDEAGHLWRRDLWANILAHASGLAIRRRE